MLGESSNETPYLGIEVTRQCNLHCPHCFTSSGSSAHPGPSTEMLKRLLCELADAGIRSVAFSGGEPLIREDLSELIRHGKDAGIADFGLVTNGYFASIGLARALSEAGLDTVQVSLDGVDAVDHAAVRGCGRADFYRALRAIGLFKDCGLTIHVATILSPRNVERAPEMAMFCQALAVDGLRYCTFVPKGRATSAKQVQAFAVQPADLDQFISFVQTLNEKPDARLAVSIDHAIGPWSLSGEFHCDSGKRVAYISAEGDLYPCPGLLSKRFRVGNVFETSIRELLASESMSAVRHISRAQIQGRCAACSNRACSGGCRGLAYAATGDVYGDIPYCHFCRVQ
jgi:radical SAM protein with 4Fe4S-binding SPASM domain